MIERLRQALTMALSAAVAIVCLLPREATQAATASDVRAGEAAIIVALAQPNASAEPAKPKDVAAFHQRARAAIGEVLAEPEYAELRADPSAFGRRVTEWFSSLVEGVGKSLGKLPGWLAWVIVVWMIVTLVAILAHLVYTLVRMLGGVSRASPALGRSTHPGQLLGVPELEFDSMYKEAYRLLATGDWLAATKYLYVAAILWLDRRGVIAFKLWKTNRDYVEELRTNSSLQAAFRSLTGCFEPVIYGGQCASMATTQDMANTVERLMHEPAVAVAT